MESLLDWLHVEYSSFSFNPELAVYENDAQPGTFDFYTKHYLSAAIDFVESKWDDCSKTLSLIEEVTEYETAFNTKHKSVVLSLLRSSQNSLALATDKPPQPNWEDDIMTESEMSPKDKALVLAIKAYILRHANPTRAETALEYATEALSLDPEEPIYAFICGRALATLRYEKKLPDVEKALRDEIAYYETASKSEDLFYVKVHSLGAYSDLSRRLFFQNGYTEDVSSTNKMIRLIKECMADEKIMNSLLCLTNCAFVASKQPKLRSLGLPEVLAKHIASLSDLPTQSVAVLVADILGQSKPQYALDYLGKFPHKTIQIETRKLNLEILLGRTVDVEETFNELSPLAVKPKHKFDLLMSLSVYLLLKKDLVKALKYFLEALDVFPNTTFYMGYKSPLMMKMQDLQTLYLNEINIGLELEERYDISVRDRGYVVKAKQIIMAMKPLRQRPGHSLNMMRKLLNPIFPYIQDGPRNHGFPTVGSRIEQKWYL